MAAMARPRAMRVNAFTGFITAVFMLAVCLRLAVKSSPNREQSMIFE
jgi:hypothetical protein